MLLVGALLMTPGCAARRSGVSGVPIDAAAPWSVEQARHVLEQGVSSEDAGLRAAAWVAWLSSDDPAVEPLMGRAVMDPSPVVQQELARRVPQVVGSWLAERSGVDPLALAWLARSGVGVPMPTEEPWSLLIPLLNGQESMSEPIGRYVEDEMDLPDSSLLAFLGSSGLVSLGEPLMRAADRADSDVATEMRLAALALGSTTACRHLINEASSTEVLAWALEVAVSQPTPEAVAAIRGLEGGRHDQMAKIALAALGEGDIGSALSALKSEDRDTRAWAAWALERAPARPHMPREEIAVLQSTARDESPLARERSVRAIAVLGGVEWIPLEPPHPGLGIDRVDVFLAGMWLAKLTSEAPAGEAR